MEIVTYVSLTALSSPLYMYTEYLISQIAQAISSRIIKSFGWS